MRQPGLGLLFAAAAFAQDVVSVRAGMIHHIEGDVYLNAAKLKEERISMSMPTLRSGSTLRTERGRAEVLLSPGVIFRVATDSTVKMVGDSLTDTRLELIGGSAMLEVMDSLKGNVTTIAYRDATIVPRRPGIYRVGGEMPELMCYDGAVDLTRDGKTVTLKRGRAVMLHDWKLSRKFDPRRGDSLVQWTAVRSEKLAIASRGSVASLVDMRRGWRTSTWRWDPGYGMFSYIPASGYYCGYFGSCFYAPQAYYSTFVAPPPRWDSSQTASGGGRGYDSGGGYATVSQRGYEAPSVSSAPAASAPAPAARSSESASGRGGEGGGRSQ